MPQLNPEFFISQIFWLIISFTFLFMFLWRISLPRISSILEKRANKISEDIKIAKQYQTEAETIQINIDTQLRNTKIETADLIKSANSNIQDHIAKELERIDKNLNSKLDDTSVAIEKSKNDSFKQINEQIYEITKLTLSKITNIKAGENEIKEMVDNIQKKAVN